MIKKLNNLKVKQKIFFAFFSSILMLGIVGGVGIYNMSSIHKSLKSISQEHMPSLDLLIQIDRDMQQALVAQRTMIFSSVGSPTFKQLVEDYNENIGQMKDRWEQFKVLGHEGITNEEISEFENAKEEWLKYSDKIVERRSSDTPEGRIEAIDLSFREGSTSFEGARDFIDKFTEKTENIANKEVNNGESIYSGAFTIILSIISIAIAFAIITGLYIGNNISKPIMEISSAAKQVTNGNLDVNVKLNTEDELGDLAISFNEMTEQLKIQLGYLDNLPTPIMIINNEFEISYMNKKGAEVIAKPKEALVGKKCYDQFKTTHCNTEKCACLQAMKNDATVVEETIARPNSKEIPIMYTGAPVKNKDGKIIGALEYIADISDIKERENYLKTSTQNMLEAMHKFAGGDLTVQITPQNNNDDIGKLFNGFNNSISQINNVMNQVLEAVHATASASTQISSSAEEMAAGSEEQSSQTSEVATAMEQMAATIAETTKNVVNTNEAAKESKHLATNGQVIIDETIKGMRNIENVVKQASDIILQLGSSSEQIGKIVQVINEIADQTNLLALNAAIEAARAGEHGRGFAVVADEVRKLAERTTVATKEIADMIVKIQNDSNNAVTAIQKGNKEVSTGLSQAEKAGISMNEIVKSSDKVLEISSQVAVTSEEQSATVEQISKSIESINAVSQESAMGVQQVANATNDLNQLTEQLQQMVGKFKLRNEHQEDYNWSTKKRNEKVVT
jgi:methyl-accepting chemotaxis protein